ncbi:hypothetical protein L249_1524 [Ophiocordyceps polyrhachis-furcata BCC 54312]|uniref:Uncharacterized protein n=1 Tax=Ophiocordyceps polyrhachis-furcata BCC 54312 TaxID=1330021 RepID=A0A367L465_9HYPO|nr:hypothetical protein L249_1524 [Ophiocordyceps polyrhachis-furcata BCC 54312]
MERVLTRHGSGADGDDGRENPKDDGWGERKRTTTTDEGGDDAKTGELTEDLDAPKSKTGASKDVWWETMLWDGWCSGREGDVYLGVANGEEQQA